MDAYKKNSATSVALDIDNNAADTTTTTINPVDQVQAQKANQAQQWPRSIYRIAEKTNQEKVTGAMSLSRTAAVVTIPILQSDNREIIGPDKEEEEESSTTTTTAAYNYPVVQKLNARVRINHLAAMAEASTLMKLTRAGVEENNSMALDEEVTAMTNTLLYNSFSMVPVVSSCLYRIDIYIQCLLYCIVLYLKSNQMSKRRFYRKKWNHIVQH